MKVAEPHGLARSDRTEPALQARPEQVTLTSALTFAVEQPCPARGKLQPTC
jgi:hypothetical protein